MRTLLAVGFALTALPASAHPGDHSAVPLSHLVTAPDHVLVLAMLAAIVALPVVRVALRRVRK